MAITDEAKVRARHHLGYLGVGSAQTFLLGIPAAVQTQFMIEGAFTRLLPESEPKFLELLDNCDGVEKQLVRFQKALVASAVDTIQLNPKEFERLLDRYSWWRSALGNMLGIAPNPFDQRFGGWTGGGGLNIPVSH